MAITGRITPGHQGADITRALVTAGTDAATQQLLATIDQAPVAAITAYWLAMAEYGVDVTPQGVAEVVVDHQCARGDYAGCSSELEMAYTEYMGWANQALGAT